MRLTPGQSVTPSTWFATYVNETLTRHRTPNALAHLLDFGAAVLGSRQDADTIISEWLASDEG